MPGVDYSAPLAAASGQAATDWGSVSGGAQVTLSAAAQLRRGINLDLGIMGLANIEASLSKFLSAEVTAQAQAQASLRAQVQVPMNLFGEIGMAVRLEAIAELAAGISGSLGISVGDFVGLVENSPGMDGIPSRLLRILLEEITLQAGVFVKAALSAQAYAHLVIAGTAIANPARSLTPGFNITAGMGAGLKAGAGFRVFANLGVQNFSRLVGRSVDAVVDEAIDQAQRLVEDDGSLRAALHGARAPLKTGLRLAYELGDFIATTSPAASAAGAEALAFRASQVVLEESQRFLLRAMGEFGLGAIRDFLAARAGGAAWDAASTERDSLARCLETPPAQLFDDSPAAQRFWADAIDRSIALAVALDGSVSTSLLNGLSAAWCALQLAAVAAARATRVQGSASVIGLPPRQAAASFSGPLPSQPPTTLRQFIRQRLQAMGRSAGSTLTQDDLLAFLADASVVGPVVSQVPGAAEFLGPFANHLGNSAAAVGATLLRNIGALGTSSGGGSGAIGAGNAGATLEALAGALREHLDALVTGPLSASLRPRLAARPDVLMAFDEVAVPSLRFVCRTVVDQLPAWSQGTVSKDALTEALSGVVIRVLGRSLVAIGDVLLAQAQSEIGRIMLGAADAVSAPGGLVTQLRRSPVGGASFDEVAEVIGDALRVGAEVFGPLPDSTRALVRSSLFEVVDLLPADADDRFIDELLDGDFVPNAGAITELAGTLAAVAIERFLVFVEKFLLRLAERLLEAIVEFVQGVVDAVVRWIEDVAALIGQIAARLIELAGEIAALVAETADRFADAGAMLLEGVASLRRQSVRNDLVDAMADEFSGSIVALAKRSGVYDLVKGVRELRQLFKDLARQAFRAALRNEFVDDLLESVGEAADAMSDLVDDLRAVNPEIALAPQVAELVLDRIEESVDAAFGDPIRVRVEFSIDIPLVGTKRVSLGRVDLDLDPILDIVRGVARTAGVFEDAVADAAANLAAAFGADAGRAEREEEERAISTERDRLVRHRDGGRPRSRGVEILSPVTAEMAGGASRIDIRIQGADRSMLERIPGVPDRVHVLLNGAPIPLDRLTVVESAGAPTAAAAAGLAHGLDLGAGIRARGAEITLVSPTDPGPLGAPGIARSVPASVRAANRRGAAPAARAIPDPPARPNRGRAAGLDRMRNGGPRLDDAKRSDPMHGLAIGPVGGFATRGLGMRAPFVPVAAGEEPSLALRAPLTPSMLVPGVNTLAVVVVWPNGESIRRAVSFLAEEVAAADAGGARGSRGGSGAGGRGSGAGRKKPAPGRDGKLAVIPRRRMPVPALVRKATKGEATMPARAADAAPPTPATRQSPPTSWRLPLPPRSDRRAMVASLVRSLPKRRADAAAAIRGASPILARRIGRAGRRIPAAITAAPPGPIAASPTPVAGRRSPVAPRVAAESPLSIAARPRGKRRPKRAPRRRRRPS